MSEPAPTLNPDAVEAGVMAWARERFGPGIHRDEYPEEQWALLCDLMRAAIAAYEAAQWQRGDRAQPLDGTEVLVWDQGHIDHGIWSEGLWLIRESNLVLPAEKVWWRPMPTPPDREGRGST